MNQRYTTTVLVLLVLLLPSTVAQAYVRMPVGNSLQPMPRTARPHVSGNVNASTKTATSSAKVLVSQSNANVPTNVAQPATVPEQDSMWGWILGALAVLTVAAASSWYYLFRIPE